METKQTIIRIGKYKRCSTDKQELTIQNETCEKHIQRMKEDHPEIEYVIIDYSDSGVSGKSIERPALTQLLKDVENKKLDLIIVTKLDRLCRSLQDMLNTTTIFKNNDADFVVISQNIDTSNAQGRLMFHVIGAFAEFEREMIKERMFEGRKKAIISGSKSGKPCHRPRYEIDEDGVVFKFKKGVSMNEIAKQYEVSITPIRRILKNRGEI